MNLQQVVFEFLSPDAASLPRDCMVVRRSQIRRWGKEGGNVVKRERERNHVSVPDSTERGMHKNLRAIFRI